jgi:hypothetical protein
MSLNVKTEEELLDYSHYLTVGDLKKFIIENNIPDNAMVVTQRVEDMYFEPRNPNRTGWGVLLKDNGYSLDKNLSNQLDQDDLNKFKTQYSPTWSCVGYEDKRFLFIDLHY